jgi:hypothetical protein
VLLLSGEGPGPRSPNGFCVDAVPSAGDGSAEGAALPNADGKRPLLAPENGPGDNGTSGLSIPPLGGAFAKLSSVGAGTEGVGGIAGCAVGVPGSETGPHRPSSGGAIGVLGPASADEDTGGSSAGVCRCVALALVSIFNGGVDDAVRDSNLAGAGVPKDVEATV